LKVFSRQAAPSAILLRREAASPERSVRLESKHLRSDPSKTQALLVAAALVGLGMIFPFSGVSPKTLQADRDYNPFSAGLKQISDNPAHADNTIKRLSEMYIISEWDKSRETILAMSKRDMTSSATERKEYFSFLREATQIYDNFAEELFWCWKRRECGSAAIKDQCPFFSSLVDQLAAIDRIASTDAFNKDAHDDPYEYGQPDYISLQMPNVTIYFVHICRNYAHPMFYRPEDKPHRRE
jgi:hypothetical protein